MSHLQFNLNTAQTKRTTQSWLVMATDGVTFLGNVSWYSAWRRYVFYPAVGTLFDAACLNELEDFLTTVTKDQQQTWKHSHGPGITGQI